MNNNKTKKAVVTILGLAGGKVEKKENKSEYINFKTKAKYKFNNKKSEYTNTLPLWIEKYKDYKIVPIYTNTAKNLQIKLIKENENKDISNLFDDNYLIKDENDYNEVFRVLNKAISTFDECYIDLTHGFRHIPILATVNLIIANIQDISKIKHIWFAKELVKPENHIQGEYEVIDLKEYLDLANLSFVITNFKDNYTTSKHIETKNREFQELFKAMNNFSSDLMALSLEHLFNETKPILIESIDNLLKNENIILRNGLEDLKRHINNIFSKTSHKYETYYNLAKDLKSKGYLVIALSLLFEATGFYIKSSFERYSMELKQAIHDIEEKIKNKQPIPEKGNKIATYYDLLTSCRSYIIYPQNDIKKNGKIIKKANRDKLLKEYSLYDKLSEFTNLKNFKSFIENTLETRNNLLHANSGEEIDEIENKLSEILKKFKTFCIEKDVLSYEKIRQEKKIKENWEKIENSNDIADFEKFLKNSDNIEYNKKAQEKINQIKKQIEQKENEIKKSNDAKNRMNNQKELISKYIKRKGIKKISKKAI